MSDIMDNSPELIISILTIFAFIEKARKNWHFFKCQMNRETDGASIGTIRKHTEKQGR